MTSNGATAAVCRALQDARALLVVSHVSPDGDTIGSALGLAWGLRSLGKRVTLSCADPLPRELLFLPGAEEFASRTLTDEDCVVAVDAADEARMGRVYDRERSRGVPLVVIDHHVTNVGYGTANYVRETSSTAELMLEVLRELGVALTPTIATCLLIGLVTDTQGFRTSSTDADSLRAALRLVEAGGDLHRVMDATFRTRAVGSLPVWGSALTQVRYEDGIVWAVVSQEMLRAAGGRNEMLSGLANFLSSVREARIAAVFHEVAEGQVEVGLRSSPGVDVAQVALRFGGGGHPQASGFTAVGTLPRVVEEVVAALKQVLAASPERDGALAGVANP